MTSKAGYKRHKELTRERQAAQSKAGRDIGDIPPPADPGRRDEAERSFRRFCEIYFAQTFSLAWSNDHLTALRKVERAVLFGDLFAFAMPRGSGKTSITIAACLWALLTGEREFVALIGADEGAASELLESIKTELETNDLLAADFPEVCKPIRALEGIPQRRLLYQGELIRMEFTAKAIVLPNIPGSASSEAVVVTAGITGRIRGMHYKRGDGRTIRPSLVVIDDPQTDESAASATQCATREKVLAGAVLGLAGPGQKISGIMPCTIIRPGDMAERILDPAKHPQWHGERTKMVYQWGNEELMRAYADLRGEALRRGDPPDAANAMWKERQAEIEAGSSVAWPERKNADEVSALHHAMNLRLDMGEAAFAAEYQNEPLDDTAASDLLPVDDICQKVNGFARGLVPSDATHLSAFIDVQGKLLYWVVVAWRADFTGYVVDYGAWPDQKRTYFSLADAVPSIPDKCKGGLEASLFGALTLLTTALFREWPVDGGKAVMRIGRCLIDANWGESRDTVYSFCRQSAYSANITPSHGKGIKASASPIWMWPKQEGESRGQAWVLRRGKSPIRHCIYDTNFWKSFAHTRLTIPMGGKGCLSLFKAEPPLHRMLADHLHAEYPVPVTAEKESGGGRRVNEWQARPNHPDNHFFDCLVGCCVAGSMLGAALEGHEQKSRRPPPSERPSIKEMMAQARAR